MMMGVSSPGKSYLESSSRIFHFDELEQFGVVDHVGLVHVDDDVGHANLTGKQDVLAGLGHGTVGSGHDKDGTVHLRGTGDHVLDVVGVTRAVDVGIVTLGSLVLDVRGVDGDATRLLFGRGINLVILLGSAAKFLRQNGGDRRGQGGLAVVNVSNRANVYVRFGPLEFFLSHFKYPSNLHKNDAVHQNPHTDYRFNQIPARRLEQQRLKPGHCAKLQPPKTGAHGQD